MLIIVYFLGWVVVSIVLFLCFLIMNIYAVGNILHALNNMDSDLLLIAKDDELGRKLQDLALPVRKRAPKKNSDW